MTKTLIREVFLSIQGEGRYVGEEQLFVRFCGCNLKCKYCDTDFDEKKSKEYSSEELLKEINSFGEKHTISLTGGEPLMSADFLSEVLPELKRQGYTIYLETNGTLPEQLKKVISDVDIIAADIKLPSATGIRINKSIISEFFDIAKEKEVFAKIVFNSNITEEEIFFVVNIARTYDIELILQPEMREDKFTITAEKCEEVFRKILNQYEKVRLIPQIHKFLNIR